jgi:hypothetical protein
MDLLDWLESGNGNKVWNNHPSIMPTTQEQAP